jgi:putative ABC transport system permease protein
MLDRLFDDARGLAVAQAAITTALALGVILLARRQSIHLGRETLIALIRGFVQVIIVGSVLLLLLRAPVWTSIFALLAMIFAAASIAARRARGIPGALWVSLLGIGLGSGFVIVTMTLLGAIDPATSVLIPVGSMIIANAMNSNAPALDRFRGEVGEVESHVGQIEAALTLRAESKQTVTPYVQAAVEASLIPRIDSLRSLGIVWIPGLMAGMILAGTDPIYAAIYQFVVIAMIFAAVGLTSILSTLLIRSRAFSPAQQLILRPHG